MEEPMVLGPPVDAPLYMEPPVDGVPANATFDLYCYYFAVGGPNGLLTIPIPNTKITISDTIVFLMSCICLVFLLVMLPATVRRFRATKVRALYVGYYTICWIAVITRIIRTILWWTVYHNENDLNLAGSITWIALRTLLWTVEISVLVILTQSTARKRLVARVAAISIILGVLKTVEQCIMAFVFEIHIHTYNKSSMIYWIINEASLALIYVIVILLRVFRCCLHHMPAKTSFYVYIVFLLCVHVVTAVGYVVRAVEERHISYCIVNVSQLAYLSLFIPLLYIAFLWTFLHTNQRVKANLQTYYDDEDYSTYSSDASYSSFMSFAGSGSAQYNYKQLRDPSEERSEAMIN